MAAPDATTALRAGLNLMRRLPPKDVPANLAGLTALRPDLTEEFLQRVDQPLQVKTCPSTKRRYLLCDYNRDGDAYRSPWSNAYDPPLDDGFVPNPVLRALEVEANEALELYTQAYYAPGGSGADGSSLSSAASSVYMWELGAEGSSSFASCWLIRKEIAGGRHVSKGSWDSIHVIEVTPAPGAPAGTFRYKLTSTVLLSLLVERPDAVGSLDLSGSLTKQAVASHAVSKDIGHVARIGAMIEAMEGDMRGGLDALYIAKTREIVAALRSRGAAASASASGFVSDLAAAVHRRAAGGAGGH